VNTRTDGLAIASLILSLSSLILGPLGSIPGIICGHIARSRVRRDPSLSGDGLAVAGLIVGYLILAGSLIMLAVLLIVTARSSVGH
jgi:hypothetical protein